MVGWLKKKICSHEFKYSQLVGREDFDGVNVKWSCHKCGQVFIEECGLDVLSHGTAIKDFDTHSKPTEKGGDK